MVLVLYMMEISPPCRAVLMTIRQLGLQVELREENLVIGNSKRHPEFMKINPRTCVPTIDDDGFYLWESRAIMTYLINKYSPNHSLYPKDPKKRALVDMMLNFDQGTLYRSQVEYLKRKTPTSEIQQKIMELIKNVMWSSVKILHNKFRKPQKCFHRQYPVIFRQESPDLTRETSYRHSLAILDRSLERNAYVAGKYLTLADLSIVASISLAEAYDYNFRPFINIVEWLRRLKSELTYYREVNEIPLLQFKFWYRPFVHSDGEEITPFEFNRGNTKL